MSNIIDMTSVTRQRRAGRNDVPEGGAMILLFTGVQYVRDEQDLRMYEKLAAQNPLLDECDHRPVRRRARAGGARATKH